MADLAAHISETTGSCTKKNLQYGQNTFMINRNYE